MPAPRHRDAAGICRSTRSFEPAESAALLARVRQAVVEASEPQRIGRLTLDTRLLDILACPVCKGPLRYERKEAQLICRGDRLAFPIRDGIPVMLEDEARVLAPDDPLLDT